MENRGLRILQLTAANVKRINVVDITPDRNFNQVTGKNGHGKSSLLDGIWWALDNARAINDVPLRRGAQRGNVRLDLGDLIVERTFNAKGTTTVTVRDARGAKPGTPDKKLTKLEPNRPILDALMEKLAFDPFDFTRKDRRLQFDELCKISEIDLDLDALAAANKKDFTKRTDVNRDAKKLRAQADGVAVEAGLPDEPVDEDALLNTIQEAGEHNLEIEKRKGRREKAAEAVAAKRTEAENALVGCANAEKAWGERREKLLRELEELEQSAKSTAEDWSETARAATETAVDLQAKIDVAEPLPAPIDASEARESLRLAKITNLAVAARVSRDKLNADASTLEAEAVDLTDRMAARGEEKRVAIEKAKMPIEGLGFGDGYVTFNDLPFDQESDSGQLRISTAIAMAGNPKLKVIRIRDGSLLDEDNLKMLADMAREKDFQIWIERVDSSGKVGIVMEDGMVKAAPQPAEETA